MSHPIRDPSVEYDEAVDRMFRWLWTMLGAMMCVPAAFLLSAVVRPPLVTVPFFLLAALMGLAQAVRYLAKSIRRRRVALKTGRIAYSRIPFTDDHPIASAMIVIIPICALAVLLGWIRHH